MCDHIIIPDCYHKHYIHVHGKNILTVICLRLSVLMYLLQVVCTHVNTGS